MREVDKMVEVLKNYINVDVLYTNAYNEQDI